MAEDVGELCDYKDRLVLGLWGGKRARDRGDLSGYVFGATMPDGRCVGLTPTSLVDDVMAWAGQAGAVIARCTVLSA